MEQDIFGFSANLLEVFEGDNFGCRVWNKLHVGMFIIFGCAPGSIKKSISRSGDENLYSLGFLREVELFKFFLRWK